MIFPPICISREEIISVNKLLDICNVVGETRVYEVGLKNNNNNKNVDCTNDINEIQHDDEFARRYLPQMTKERNRV